MDQRAAIGNRGMRQSRKAGMSKFLAAQKPEMDAEVTTAKSSLKKFQCALYHSVNEE